MVLGDCENRRKAKWDFALHRKPSGTLLAQNKEDPLNHCGHKTCFENISRYEHFAKYNTATRLINHQIHTSGVLVPQISTESRCWISRTSVLPNPYGFWSKWSIMGNRSGFHAKLMKQVNLFNFQNHAWRERARRPASTRITQESKEHLV